MHPRRSIALLVALLMALATWLTPGAATADPPDDQRKVVKIDNRGKVKGPAQVLRGTLLAAAIEGRKGKRTVYAVHSQGRAHPLKVAKGQKLPANGDFEGLVTVGSDPGQIVTATITEAAVANAVSARAHASYVAYPAGVGTYPTESAMAATVDQADAHLASDLPTGISSFARNGLKTYTSTKVTAANCQEAMSSPFTAWNEAAAVAYPGLDFVNGAANHLVMLLPESCAAGGILGVGTMGLPNEGGFTMAFASDTDTVIHELGHNLGFGHANLYNTDNATESAYCDIYSVMGFGLDVPNHTALGTGHRSLLGFASASEMTTLPATTVGSTSYTLTGRGESSGLRGLKLIEPGTNRVYYVDYRSATGRDAGQAYTSNGEACGLQYAPGVALTTTGADPTETALIPGPIGRAYASVGETLSTLTSQIQVKVNSMSGSTASVTVTYTPLANFTTSPKPTIVGTVTRGSTVSASAPGWSPTPETQTFQWRIDGQVVANGPTYLIEDHYVESGLSVAVTSTKTGYVPTTTVSDEVQVMGPPLMDNPPVPMVVGIAKPGQTLTVDTGTYPEGAFTTLDWSISSAQGWQVLDSGDTLVVTPAMEGRMLKVRVTASKSGFMSTEVYSEPFGPIVGDLKQLTVGTPYFTGRMKTYRYLTAYPGTWTSGTTFRYQWNANGVPILNATKKRLYLRRAQRGQMITVTVTGSQAGYLTASATSAARGPVQR